MAENIPLSSNSAVDATRGVPYYEKLKRDLRDTLQKKRALDKNLATLEDQIYRHEASYLEETGAGNIIKGFANYIKGTTTAGNTAASAGGGTSTRRKGQVVEADRIFSRSSASFMRNLKTNPELMDYTPSQELSPTSSAQTTPSHAPTPTSGIQAPNARESNHPTPTSATNPKGSLNNKKGRRSEKDDDEYEGKAPKRLKITYGRGASGD